MTMRLKAVAVCSLLWAGSLSAQVQSNLCFNGGFDNTNSPLERWNYDYAWEGNSWYMNNRDRVSVLPEFHGRKKVLFINATGHSTQTKVESNIIPVERLARYRCTLDLYGGGDVRFYFNGYKLEPGVPPSADPRISELRRIYKSEAFTGGAPSWRTISFEFPMAELSELGWSRLKEVRFFTIKLLANCPTYVDNVKVVKLKGAVKVVKRDFAPMRGEKSGSARDDDRD